MDDMTRCELLKTISEYQFVAVELNGNIIKQADFGSTTITDADKLEIVSFVGGG